MFQMFDRTKGYASKIVGKPFELGLNDFDSVKNLSQETIPKPVLSGSTRCLGHRKRSAEKSLPQRRGGRNRFHGPLRP